MTTPFTVLMDDRALRGPATIRDGGVILKADPGWAELGLPAGRASDLAEIAARLDRPMAVDREERAAFLGVSARTRGERLASLEAPDFSLPDLEGRHHALVEQRDTKVLLVAYASW